MANDANEQSKAIFLSIPVFSPEKFGPQSNQIFLSQKQISNILLIEGLRLYYSPAEICNYALSFSDTCSQSLLFLSYFDSGYLLLLNAKSKEAARSVYEFVQQHPSPICSMDEFHCYYVHSVCFMSVTLTQVYSAFCDSSNLINENCPICLNPCNSESMLFSLPCSHTLHAKCMTKMSQWRCPFCRYEPFSGLDAVRCEICNESKNLFICLCCAQTFCSLHCHDHFQTTKHPYYTSSDRQETWNLMNGSTMSRIALEKTGEFVEMCAKDDMLNNYLEQAIEEQIVLHSSILYKKRQEEQEIVKLKADKIRQQINAKREEIEKKKKLIEERKDIEKKIPVVQSLLNQTNQRLRELPKLNQQLETQNRKFNQEIIEKADLIKDMEANCSIITSAAFKGDNEQIHVQFTKTKK